MKGNVDVKGNILGEGTLGVYSDFSVGGNSTLLGQLEVNETVSALSNVIVSDDVIATGVISADIWHQQVRVGR